MDKKDAKSKPALGFLTVVETAEHGLFGGYLILNAAGRPLEFHCTAPLRPNRAQEILYGPTLGPFLYGEQIGGTLVAKAKVEPLVVCTDCEPALAVRDYVDWPVALVLPGEDGLDRSNPNLARTPPEVGPETIWRVDAAHSARPPLVAFRLGRNRLAVLGSREEDRRRIVDSVAAVADTFDLAEPFGRIREAIDEARRGGQPH